VFPVSSFLQTKIAQLSGPSPFGLDSQPITPVRENWNSDRSPAPFGMCVCVCCTYTFLMRTNREQERAREGGRERERERKREICNPVVQWCRIQLRKYLAFINTHILQNLHTVQNAHTHTHTCFPLLVSAHALF